MISKPQVLAFADVVIHGFGTPREHVFDESAGGHQNVVGVAEVDEFPDHPPWHEAEGTGGKLQRIHVATNGFQHVLQVSLAHDGVVGAADFGDSASARFALTLVKLQTRTRDPRRWVFVTSLPPYPVGSFPGPSTTTPIAWKSEWFPGRSPPQQSPRREGSANGALSRSNLRTIIGQGMGRV